MNGRLKLILLAIETSAEVCSLAITEDAKLLTSIKWAHKMQLSTRLIGILDQLFATASLSRESVDAYAIGLGPGSFTGTRVAVVMGKTLSVATGKPLYGVDSLAMMAQRTLEVNPDYLSVSLLNARIGEVYAAVYQQSDDRSQVLCVNSPSVHTPESLQILLETEMTTPFIVSGQIPVGFEWVRNHHQFRSHDFCLPNAELLAEISYKQALNGKPLDALLQMPCYVKQASVTVSKRRLVNPFAPD